LYFLSLKYIIPAVFSDLDASAKELSIFQNWFNYIIEELPPKLPLEVICNVMTY